MNNTNSLTPAKSQLIFILVTMFLNFLGFSIIIPILPFLVNRFTTHTNETAIYVGLLLSIYALCQFIATPGLGALSDRYGRRPILMISLLGSVIGYLFLGFGGALWVLFLGRIIDGLTGGNISTVYAYMADITEPKVRGKYYGLLGAAGGFGFMIGPALGGILAGISLSTPLFVAAIITMLNVLWGFFILPESLHAKHRSGFINLAHLNPFTQFNHIFTVKVLLRLFLISFIYFLSLNAMYGNTSVFLKDVLNWNVMQIGVMLFVVGAIDVITQGFLVRKLIPILGDARVSALGLFLAFIGFFFAALTIFTDSQITFYIGIILLNIGDGLYEPSTTGLVSVSAGPQMQGRIQGAFQSLQSITRIIGPLVASWIYRYWHGLPYTVESILVFFAFILLIISLPAIHLHYSLVSS